MVELKGLREYVTGTENEDAGREKLYPLFRALFKDKFRLESSASGADIYIEGKLLVEIKSKSNDWLNGVYQALHYAKKGLTYATIMVVARQFIGIWKVNRLPDFIAETAHKTDPVLASQKAGIQNAKKTTKSQTQELLDSAFYLIQPDDFKGGLFQKSMIVEAFEVLKILKNLDAERLQINPHNFIQTVEAMQKFFDKPMDAVHAFYAIVAYWDITSTVAESEYSNAGDLQVIGFKGKKLSETVHVPPKRLKECTAFIEKHYVFTNEGSGLSADYYFSRFDEVIAKLQPEYAKQHGIFFTDRNLARYALWFVESHFEVAERYIVFDPAGGSGNLVSSWRGKLKHKIVSELQPDLLRTVERRMKADPYHLETGFTIIPKTSENKGLNFLSLSAEEYLGELTKELERKHMPLDRPVAFLLNPPYKSTDENEEVRHATEAHYNIDPNILALTGADAGKERYLAFLGQILRMAQLLTERNPNLPPLLMIFTPTSWLIPRPTYVSFRKIFDAHFRFETGFMVTGKEFFKVDGKWPLAFTVWQYAPQPDRTNAVRLYDLNHLKHLDLDLNWLEDSPELHQKLQQMTESAQRVDLTFRTPLIKEGVNQSMFDFKRDPTGGELKSGKIFGGLPLKDPRRTNKKTYGIENGSFIGFMDDLTPVRVKQDTLQRMSNQPDRVWFRLDLSVKDINKIKMFNGAADNRSFCAYDLASARALFTWFGVGKAINGRYPLWANQYDLWLPRFSDEEQHLRWLGWCYAYALAEHRCVVTRFPAGDPVPEAPAVYVDNPMSPFHPEGFWQNVLEPETAVVRDTLAGELIETIRDLYRLWNRNYTHGERVENVGLDEEPYFKYFDAPDFITPHSGWIQIKRFADVNGCTDLIAILEKVSTLKKKVLEELFRLLVSEGRYFE